MEIIIATAAILLFQAILFLQSGLDKVFDFQGNMDWLKGHFSESPLAPLTKPMVVALTLLELATGAASLLAVIFICSNNAVADKVSLYAFCLASASYIALFFGQRMAKDYAGAASIPAYFIVSLLGFFLLSLA